MIFLQNGNNKISLMILAVSMSSFPFGPLIKAILMVVTLKTTGTKRRKQNITKVPLSILYNHALPDIV